MKEQYLKNKFYTESLQVEDWNNPPDSVFATAMEKVTSHQEVEATDQAASLNEKFYNESVQVDEWNNPPDYILTNTLATVREQKALDAQESLNDKFYNESLQVDDWNNPTDVVFKNAIAEVGRSKKNEANKRLTRALLLLLLMSVIGISSFVGYKFSVHNSELVQLKNEIKVIKQPASQPATEIGIKEASAASQNFVTSSTALASQAQESRPATEETSKSQSSNNKVGRTEDLDRQDASSRSSSSQHSGISASESDYSKGMVSGPSILNEVSDKTRNRASSEISSSESGKLAQQELNNSIARRSAESEGIPTKANLLKTAVGSIATLNQDQVVSENVSGHPLVLDYTMELNPVIADAGSNKDRGLFLNTKAINRRSNFIMRGLPANKDLHLTKYDEYRSNFSVEFNLEKNLKNNFSLYAGLGYQKLVNNSESVESLSYSSFNETDTGDGYIYTENMILDTPLGFRTETVNFSTDESIEGTELSQMTQTQQSLNIINLRIGLRKRFEYNKIAISPYFALGSNFVTGTNTTFDATIFSDDNVVMRAPKAASELTLLNKHFLTAEIGSSIHYRVSNRVSVGLDVGYEQSITSLRKSNGGLKTFTNSLITGVSFRTAL